MLYKSTIHIAGFRVFLFIEELIHSFRKREGPEGLALPSARTGRVRSTLD